MDSFFPDQTHMITPIMCSSLIVLNVFIAITFIIRNTKDMLLIMAYKLWDLCTTYRQMSCATSQLKSVNMLLLIYVQVFREFEMGNICSNNVI